LLSFVLSVITNARFCYKLHTNNSIKLNSKEL
jgi:hypothetical protein